MTPSSSLRPCTESHHTIYTNFITPGRLACSAVRHQHLQTLAHHHTSAIIPSSPNCGATSIKIGTFAFDSRSNCSPIAMNAWSSLRGGQCQELTLMMSNPVIWDHLLSVCQSAQFSPSKTHPTCSLTNSASEIQSVCKKREKVNLFSRLEKFKAKDEFSLTFSNCSWYPGGRGTPKDSSPSSSSSSSSLSPSHPLPYMRRQKNWRFHEN